MWRPKPEPQVAYGPGSLDAEFPGIVLSRDVELLVRAGPHPLSIITHLVVLDYGTGEADGHPG